MASSSGTSSGSSQFQNSGSDEAILDQRKRKRMISNRESARRSRMKKQKLLDDLSSEVSHLKEENHQIISSINITTQHLINIEAENSVLRAQAEELSNRLESLNEIINALNNAGNGGFDGVAAAAFMEPFDDFFNPMNMNFMNQPIMASPDLFQY